MKKMGRPPSKNPRDKNLYIRLTSDELAFMTETAELLKTTRTAVINKGVKLVRDEAEKKLG